jgi:GT2 family glycosyltransferase
MISIIIVNYGSAFLTKRAVDSVLCEDEASEIFVVDNTATDDERFALRDLLPSIVNLVFNEKNEGFAKACNKAYALSKGEWIFLLNPDAYILPGALKHLKEFLINNPRAGAVGPKIYWDEEKTFLLPPSILPSPKIEIFSSLAIISKVFSYFFSMIYRWNALKVWKAVSPLKQESLSGGHVMLRRSAIEGCGGLFDEEFFMYYEDSDLMYRLKKSGYYLFIEPRAEVIHNYFHKRSKLELMEKSRILYFNKNFHNSPVLKISRWIAGLKVNSKSKDFVDTGKSKHPVKFKIPDKMQKRWLFEWSPNWMFIPSVGNFGSGHELVFHEKIWNMLDPGIYYARVSYPQHLTLSSICWLWEKL